MAEGTGPSPRPAVFLTVREVAQELNVGKGEVRALIANGTLPAQRTEDGRLRVERLMLERWVRDQCTASREFTSTHPWPASKAKRNEPRDR